ncbi:12100_t:CDS:1 [Funneliformis mosseae]|uniref:12100_t:CDS:1 n=1 Tax=Funneliformis mosseae TaxID=27381 RepID=A0A9N8WI65_FUNMO|nr:12100_t:CDS:1 [Funneliformis mosseae]
MSPKRYTPIINILIILVILSTTINSNLLIKRDDVESFICTEKANQKCCALLAYKIAHKHHSRVASIVIINKCGFNINLLEMNLNSGRWITQDDHQNLDISCEPQTLPLANGQSEIFSSITSGFLGGVKGSAQFLIDDNITSTEFSISWEVPLIGSPKYELEGLPTKKYYNESKYDIEDTVYKVTVN